MAEVHPITSRGEDIVELDGSTSSESVPPSIAAAAESPLFLIWMCIQILTVCSGVVWGARGGRLSGPRMLTQASGAQQHSLEDSEPEVLSRIAASKSTWSEAPGRDIRDFVSVPCPSELPVGEELKASALRFFREDFAEYLELGRLIGEGDQAQIYEAKLRGFDSVDVLKVFKSDAGFSLADLKRHWPCSMRKGGEDCSESTSGQERSSGFVFEDGESNIGECRCLIHVATLLQDGRFAFLMRRYRAICAHPLIAKWIITAILGSLTCFLTVEDSNHPS